VVVHAPEDHVHGLEPPHRAEPHLPVLHRQVAAARDRVAEVARQVRVLEVRLVQRARRQHDDARIGPPARRQRREARAQVLEEERQPVHVRVAVQARQHAAQDDAILERSDARRRLRAVAQHLHAVQRALSAA
jgi:hypothetical protein